MRIMWLSFVYSKLIVKAMPFVVKLCLKQVVKAITFTVKLCFGVKLCCLKLVIGAFVIDFYRYKLSKINDLFEQMLKNARCQKHIISKARKSGLR